MSGYQVHPDEMSTWCRSNVCAICEDDLCEHDCHYDDDEPSPPNWRKYALLWSAYLVVVFGIYTVVDLLIPWTPLRVAGYVLAFLLLVFGVYPWLQRRIGGES